MGLIAKKIRFVGPYEMSDLILKNLLMKTQMQVKMTMILHWLANESGLDRIRLGGMWFFMAWGIMKMWMGTWTPLNWKFITSNITKRSRGLFGIREKGKLDFFCHSYYEQKKVKLVVIEFTKYTLIWWDQIVINKRRSDPFRLGGR